MWHIGRRRKKEKRDNDGFGKGRRPGKEKGRGGGGGNVINTRERTCFEPPRHMESKREEGGTYF